MNRLRELRKKKNLTLRDLSDILNISFGQLGKLERGESLMSSEQIKLFTDFFNVSADYLLGLPTKAIPLNDGTFKHVKILGSVNAGPPNEALQNFDGFLMAKVEDAEEYFYLQVKGDSMSPTFEADDYVLVRFQNNAENNQIVVAGLNGFEATVKRFKKIGDDCFLFADNELYDPIKLTDDLEPYIVGVVEGFYRPRIK